MKYALPPQLSQQFSISLKTVYNYLKRYPTKIRIKKEYGKRFVNLEDFTKVLQESYQVQSPSFQKGALNEPIKSDGIENVNDSKIQEDYKLVLVEKERLEKINRNQEEQLQKYSMLLKEEKAEKKDVLNRFESLQKDYNNKIEDFGLERIRYTKRYYSLLILCVVSLLILIRLVVPNILEFFSN